MFQLAVQIPALLQLTVEAVREAIPLEERLVRLPVRLLALRTEEQPARLQERQLERLAPQQVARRLAQLLVEQQVPRPVVVVETVHSLELGMAPTPQTNLQMVL